MSVATQEPTRGEIYRAADLPPDSVVRTLTGALYVRCHNITSLQRWRQPIPGSEHWRVEYLGEAIEVEPTPEVQL